MGSVSSLNEKSFTHHYQLGKKIGVGSFATVHKCFRKHDSAEFAVKIINKTHLSYKERIALRNEILILKKISHENIIKLIDVFDDGKFVYLILEMCNDKDLYEQMVSSKQKHFSEKKAAQIIYALSKALQHLHSNGVCHRDLKPQNILFGMDGTIKLSDFGLARFYQRLNVSDTASQSYESIILHTTCGTPRYVAPEVLSNNGYDKKCDLWSVGVILYLLLAGDQPFKSESVYEIYKLIVQGKYDFDSERWNNISEGAKDLVTCLLQVDPSKRYSAKDIENHPWIVENMKHIDEDIECENDNNNICNNIYKNVYDYMDLSVIFGIVWSSV